VGTSIWTAVPSPWSTSIDSASTQLPGIFVIISGAPPGIVPQTRVKSDESELLHAPMFSDLLYRKIRIIPSPAAPSR
jgi:hypothetical protein